MALEAARRASRAARGVWPACVALAAHAALCRAPPPRCLLHAQALATHHITAVSTHLPHRRIASTFTNHSNVYFQSSSIVLEKDLSLPLYREWSVESALRHAPALAPSLHTHARAGDQRIRTLLADTGYCATASRIGPELINELKLYNVNLK